MLSRKSQKSGGIYISPVGAPFNEEKTCEVPLLPLYLKEAHRDLVRTVSTEGLTIFVWDMIREALPLPWYDITKMKQQRNMAEHWLQPHPVTLAFVIENRVSSLLEQSGDRTKFCI